jgi:hypothetical protein
MNRRIFSTFLAAWAVVILLATGCSEGPNATNGAPESPEAALEELNTALYKWMARSPTPPRNYEELVSSDFYGKPAPAAPPGKKYAIDREELMVVLVDQ